MRRFLRPAKFVALGLLALVAVALITGALVNWWRSARLERRIAELRAEGEPVAIADLEGQPIPPENNAATYLRRVQPAVAALEKEVSEAPEADEQTMDGGPLSANMERILREAFASHPDVIDLLRQAAACPDYDSGLDYTKLEAQFLEPALKTLQGNRGAIRALNYHAIFLLNEGKREDALRDALVALRLSRHFDRDPLLLGYLVSLACRSVALSSANRALQAGDQPNALLAELEQELARHDLIAAYRHGLTTDRAYGLQTLRGMNVLVPWPFNGIADEVLYIDALDAAIAAAGDDDADWSNINRMLEEAGPVTALLTPTLNATREATKREVARLRAMRVLVALKRRQQQGHDDVPPLDQLGLPPEVTIDPFTGRPLVVKMLPEGWLVYSVGNNGQDDGGQGPDGSKSDDWGWGPKLPAKPTDESAK